MTVSWCSQIKKKLFFITMAESGFAKPEEEKCARYFQSLHLHGIHIALLKQSLPTQHCLVDKQRK